MMSETANVDQEPHAAQPPSPKSRRRWGRWLAAAVAVVLLLIVVAPYLFRFRVVRNFAVKSAMTDFKGKVDVGSAPLGWFSPVRLYNIEVSPPEGPPVMTVPSVEGDVPLWRLVFNSQELGEFTLNEPHLNVQVNEAGANFQELFPPPDPDEKIEPPSIDKLSSVKLTVAVALFDGGLSWKGPNSSIPWDVGGIRLEAGLVRRPDAPNSPPELVVEPGPLLERATITPSMCDDVLKYAAPALSGATMAQGQFSIELDQWRLPLDQPEAGVMGGRFSIHSIEVGPGPVLNSILATMRLLMARNDAEGTMAVGVPISFELAHDSVVHFEMKDGRIHHHGFEMGLGNLRLRTHGSVGLDQTIDIVAEIDLPGDALVDRPFLQALSSKTIVLPIEGTFAEPRINAEALGRSSLQAVLGALDSLADDEENGEANVMDILEATGLFGEGGLLGGSGATGDGEPTGEAVIGDGQILDLWQQWREQRQADPATAEEGETEESGRLLERLRRRRRADLITAEPAPVDELPELIPPGIESGEPSLEDEPSIEELEQDPDEGQPGRRVIFRRRRLLNPE